MKANLSTFNAPGLSQKLGRQNIQFMVHMVDGFLTKPLHYKHTKWVNDKHRHCNDSTVSTPWFTCQAKYLIFGI